MTEGDGAVTTGRRFCGVLWREEALAPPRMQYQDVGADEQAWAAQAATWVETVGDR
jgi:hypothetical protein